MVGSSDGAVAVGYCSKYSQLSSLPSSPERRFRTVSPCRRLFEELAGGGGGSAVVVGNGGGGMTATTTVFGHSGHGMETGHNGISGYTGNDGVARQFGGGMDTVAGGAPLTLPLSEGIALGYQRRKGISASVVDSPSALSFMEDLGFLSGGNAHCINHGKKSGGAHDDAAMIHAMTSSDPLVVFSHPSSSTMDMAASPTQSPRHQFLPMARTASQLGPRSVESEGVSVSHLVRPAHTTPTGNSRILKTRPCSVNKSDAWRDSVSHWNRRAVSPAFRKVIQPGRLMTGLGDETLRRTVSECVARDSETSDNGILHQLPCFDSPKDAIKRLHPSTVVDLLDGKYVERYDRLLIIDCRYAYEFEGGHIPTAINVHTAEEIDALLLARPDQTAHTVLVFHCEFSSERAPRMALHVRNMDRHLNKAVYPALCYPELYILEGGYKGFWSQFGGRCVPSQAYVPMRTPHFKEELRAQQRIKHTFRSACHLSQHGAAKMQNPVWLKRTRSLSASGAHKFFHTLLTDAMPRAEAMDVEADGLLRDSPVSELAHLTEGPTVANSYFPPYTITQTHSVSSILPSELDYPSEMDDC